MLFCYKKKLAGQFQLRQVFRQLLKTGTKSSRFKAVCRFESGGEKSQIIELLPMALALERFLFLSWLAERKSRGIFGTTVGHVDDLAAQVIEQIRASAKL